MENPFKNINIKKIEVSRLERYADILFVLLFISVLVFLGLIFYNYFLPIYTNASPDTPAGITGGNVKIKTDTLKAIIKNLGDQKAAINNIGKSDFPRDPFVLQQ